MNKEEMLFESKPCHQCPHSCVEGTLGVKCPFDLMVEDLMIKFYLVKKVMLIEDICFTLILKF